MNWSPERAGVMFLPIARDVCFAGGTLTVDGEFGERTASLVPHVSRDGFVYPPQGTALHSRRGAPAVLAEGAITLPEERVVAAPGFMVRLPESHVMQLEPPLAEPDFRRGDGAFVLNLVAALYGIRLQWSDWWFDKSVPLVGSPQVRVSRAVEEAFLSKALARWRQWPSAERRRFVASLAMHCKAQCYDWVWEQFSFEYVAFDSLYRTAAQLAIVPSGIGHGARLGAMCRAFELTVHEDLLALISRQRNEFIHECLWSMGQADLNPSDEGYQAALYLRAINHRLIPALLGERNKYTSSDWRDGGFRFE